MLQIRGDSSAVRRNNTRRYGMNHLISTFHWHSLCPTRYSLPGYRHCQLCRPIHNDSRSLLTFLFTSSSRTECISPHTSRSDTLSSGITISRLTQFRLSCRTGSRAICIACTWRLSVDNAAGCEEGEEGSG